MIIVGTRPEVIKLAPVIKAFQNPAYEKKIELILVSTGQHLSMLEQTLKVFNIHPTLNLSVMKPGQSLSQLTSSLLTELDRAMTTFSPDIVLIQGDTSSAFAGSLAAFYKQIPVGHIEAGLRTWNLENPFPEEFDRQAIGIVARYHFAATSWAKNNLLNEGKLQESIYLTGNPVVDSLFSILNTTQSSEYVKLIQRKIRKLLSDPEVILFTTHRRENQGQIMKSFFETILKILQKVPKVVIIFPMHKNPKVYEAFSSLVPEDIISSLKNKSEISDQKWQHLNRLLLIEPMDYIDLVHIINLSTLILTDSGGLQEEGTSLGKPVFILRTTTERPEAVYAGNAVLVGCDPEEIYLEVMNYLNDPEKRKKMCQPNMVYGDGAAGLKIAAILVEKLWEENDEKVPTKSTLAHSINSDYHNISSKTDDKCTDLIILVTVWKRETLVFQLSLILNQTALENKKVEVIVFQNAEHINVDAIVSQWIKIFNDKGIKLTFIHSTIETGYYGRFLVPFLVNSCPDASFIINDDDVTFGSRYYENMLRVVDSGSLCTRNGRLFSKSNSDYNELVPQFCHNAGKKQVTYETDVEIDFGGHVWAGKIEWLKNIWKNPPISFLNCEDFWMSAVLKTKFNISTKMAKCPAPRGDYNKYGELCACSIPLAVSHVNAKLGNQTLKNDWGLRHSLMNQIINLYNYTPIQQHSPEKFKRSNQYGNVHSTNMFLPSQWSDNCFHWY